MGSAGWSSVRALGATGLNIDWSRFRGNLRTVCTLLFWYLVSTSIILSSKWLFNGLFEYPLTVTTFSNTLTSVWAFLFSRRPSYRPEPLTRKKFREYVLPIGITTALEIGFSNIALKLLTVSFGTILKGGSPIFTMMWGLLFGVEMFSTNLCLSLVTIASGIALASFGEGHSFALLGFILQLLATALGGLRWAMTHVLLRGKSHESHGDEEPPMSPLTATLYTSPTTAACVLPFALLLEGSKVLHRIEEAENGQVWTVLGIMTVIGTLVFILLISEYWLVNATSSLALSVAGVFKELLTIIGGVVFFKEAMSLLNIIGFITCQLGIFAYVYIRSKPENETEVTTTIRTTEIPLTMAEVYDDDEDEKEQV
ncbi:Sugar phosphate transporter [Gracilaria domingensis]|nr:Sugar phosphate transporter [Gracilaria domingensis]